MTPENHVMIDIETLGDVILSIGAVSLREKQVVAEFHTYIQPHSCEKHGLHCDSSTVLWWMTQSDAARLDVTKPDYPPKELPIALHLLSTFVKQNPGWVWCKGAGYDFPKLVAAYRAVDMPVPWAFRDERCYRTLKALKPHVAEPAREGIHHNALHDARHQALHLNALLS